MTIRTRVVCNLPSANHKAHFKKYLGLVLGAFLLLLSGQALAQSAVVINEILQNPAAVADSNGEWFELTNTTDAAIDINGWTIRDDGSDSHVINNGGPLEIPAGGFVVLGINPDTGVNGGVTLDYSYGSGFFLSNGADELVLVNGSGVEIDRVNWDGGPVFPDPNGASMSLLDPALDNNDGANWCTSTSSFGAGDLGTPGAANVCVIPEEAPAVASTSPLDNGTGVPFDADIVITFSEDVTVTGAWFDISCSDSGGHTAVETGGPRVYTLNPDTDFVESESCTVTIIAAQVTDTDADDPPDNMAADYQFTFSAAGPPVESDMLINEVDADQSGTDAAEFVELYDGGSGNTLLDGMALVLFNGSSDTSYLAYDLTGLSTDAAGYLVLCGDLASVTNCDVDIGAATNLIQNGADAAALYLASAANFPFGTPVTTDALIDALVYDTNDADDPGLLQLLNPGQLQVNEGGAGNSSAHSNQRCPNGAGGGRNTDSYVQVEPTPGAENDCIIPVINEVDADQTGTDAAEFVELLTPGSGDFPLDGYSLVFYNGSDDASYLAFDLDGYATNAEGYFVLCGDAANVASCDLDVSPDTNLLQNGADAVALVFGDAADYPNDTPVATTNLVDALVYDTSDSDDAGLLVLLNAGQPQVNENGGGAKDTESNQRCPNGFGGPRNTDTYIQAVPTPGARNSCDAVEIYDIQGAGGASAYDGFDVLAAGNIVTAVGPEGFFIQTPDARDDGSVDTSNGIYVFTETAPTVAVGDDVDVLGRVEEFFEFTEFTNSPVVTINSSGNPLPTAVALGASVPSPDPLAPSCAIELECYEGMLVEIAAGTVTGGNQDFGSDPVAEIYITASANRSYREPGIIYPGVGGSVPTWDGNPEVFELDPDKLGLDNAIIAGGSSFTASGVVGFEFGDYELWPTSLDVTAVALPLPVRARMSTETTIGSLNLFRFATDGDYATRLTKLSLYIRNALNSPDILAVQEAADIGALQDLANQVTADDFNVNYTPYLVEGNDQGGIDVGFLVRADIAVDAVVQLGAAEIFDFDGSLLHDRPPLLLEGRYTGNGFDFPLAVMVVHNRSLNDIETERVQLKRLTQAESIAEKVQAFQTGNPDTPLVVLGDFNAFEFTDGYVDAVGHIMGDFDAAESILSGLDLVDPNLTNQVELLPAAERYSFVFEGNAQALDHALTSAAANPWVRGLEFARGNADAAHDQINDPLTAERASDHDGLVLFMMTDWDGDGVADDVDGCPFVDALVEPDAEFGCEIPIPTLGPLALWLMLLMIGGLGLFTLRQANGLTRR